jgi:hypothetical protein
MPRRQRKRLRIATVPKLLLWHWHTLAATSQASHGCYEMTSCAVHRRPIGEVLRGTDTAEDIRPERRVVHHPE